MRVSERLWQNLPVGIGKHPPSSIKKFSLQFLEEFRFLSFSLFLSLSLSLSGACFRIHWRSAEASPNKKSAPTPRGRDWSREVKRRDENPTKKETKDKIRWNTERKRERERERVSLKTGLVVGGCWQNNFIVPSVGREVKRTGEGGGREDLSQRVERTGRRGAIDRVTRSREFSIRDDVFAEIGAAKLRAFPSPPAHSPLLRRVPGARA